MSIHKKCARITEAVPSMRDGDGGSGGGSAIGRAGVGRAAEPNQ